MVTGIDANATSDSSTGVSKKQRGCLFRLFRALIFMLAFFVVSGIAYEHVMRRVVANRFPPEGNVVDVSGRRVHIQVGGEGSPTVLFEPGSGMAPGGYWGPVQNEVSSFARTIGYDKSGLGWSDSTTGSRTSRTSAQLSEELHELLEVTREHGPFILVGGSLGGIHVRVFADKYPELVAGMVLVDSTHPEQLERIPELREDIVTGLPIWKSIGYKVAANTGLLRLASGNDWVGAAFLPQSLDAVGREFRGCLESFEQAKRAKGIGDKPLIVICAGRPPLDTPGDLVGQFAVWQELQRELLSISRNSRFVVAEESDHVIEVHQPEIIVTAIREVIEAANTGKMLSELKPTSVLEHQESP